MVPPETRSPSTAVGTSVSTGDGRRDWPATADRLLQALAAQERRLWILALLLLVTDLATTAYGLGLGLSEANPAAAAALERYGIAALAALKGFALVVAAVGWLVIARRYRVVVPLCLALPWSVGSVLNLVVLVRVVGP